MEDEMAEANPKIATPVYTTVGFKSVDKDAWSAFWQDIRTRYDFAQDGDATTEVFAVSMSNMFAEQEAVEELLDADLDEYELKEALSAVACCQDLPALLAEYGVEPRK